MIEIKNVSKAYEKEQIISNYSIEIKDGECLIFSMPSGQGKTTLLRIIAGLEKPDEGSVSGVPKEIGYVFQENRLCENFTAEVNISMVSKHNKSEIEKHLQILGLGDDLRKPVKEYSGGMKRRVAIARAILSDAKVFIFDEPFTGMDEVTKNIVLEYILDNTKEKTVFLVTHDESIIGKVSNKRTITIIDKLLY